MSICENATTTGGQHPQTSVDAARRVYIRSGTGRYRVLGILVLGDYTDDEIQELLGMPANTQRPRRVELVRDGLVAATDQRRRTFTGNWSTVWTATRQGRIAYRRRDPQ